MLLKIACSCGHAGLTNAKRLPRELRCAVCGSCRQVQAKDGARIISTERRMENVAAILTAVRS
jgi:hypothetical protein